MPLLTSRFSDSRLKEHIDDGAKGAAFPPIRHAIFKPRSSRINPFQLLSGVGWVDMCQEEKQRAMNCRRNERLLRVHEKQTYQTRNAGRTLPKIKKFFDEIDKEIHEELALKEKSMQKSALTAVQKLRVRTIEKESTHELVRRKREMFFVNYTLQTKKDEIEEYQQRAVQEEEKITDMATKLRKEAMMFDDFLKATDEFAVEAMKNAEKETKLKLEKKAELRRLQGAFGIIKADVTKKDELLTTYLEFKSFLLRFHHNLTKTTGSDLTQEQWQEKREADRKRKQLPIKRLSKKDKLIVMEEKRRKNSNFRKRSSLTITQTKPSIKFKNNVSTPYTPACQIRQSYSKEVFPEEWDEDERESEALTEKISYLLKDPKLVVLTIHEMEEENLKLIYNFQRSQDALDDMKQAHVDKIAKKNKEIFRLREQVNIVKMNIDVIESKCDEMKLMCKFFGLGSHVHGDEAVADLTTKVEKVYLNVFGRVIVNIDGISMLACIEKRMDELIDQLETLPEQAVRDIQKAKDKQRRLAMREEKLLQQRLKQEERARRAQDRSNKISAKKVGRKLMFRSAPPKAQSVTKITKDGINETDSQIFFDANQH